MADLPRSRSLAVAVQPGCSAGHDDPGPRPPGLGIGRDLPRKSGRGVLPFGRPPTRADPSAAAEPGGLLQAPATARRRASCSHYFVGDVGFDPPARERHWLRVAPRLRRADGRAQSVQIGIRQRRVRLTEVRGQRVLLRPMVIEDAPRLREIHATKAVATWWGPPEDQFPFSDEPGAERMTICIDDQIAGMIQFVEETDPN